MLNNVKLLMHVYVQKVELGKTEASSSKAIR